MTLVTITMCGETWSVGKSAAFAATIQAVADEFAAHTAQLVAAAQESLKLQLNVGKLLAGAAFMVLNSSGKLCAPDACEGAGRTCTFMMVVDELSVALSNICVATSALVGERYFKATTSQKARTLTAAIASAAVARDAYDCALGGITTETKITALAVDMVRISDTDTSVMEVYPVIFRTGSDVLASYNNKKTALNQTKKAKKKRKQKKTF